jgi:hypothetical protein
MMLEMRASAVKAVVNCIVNCKVVIDREMRMQNYGEIVGRSPREMIYDPTLETL